MEVDEEMDEAVSAMTLHDQSEDDHMETDIYDVRFPNPTIRLIDKSKVKPDDTKPENICKEIIDTYNAKKGPYEIVYPKAQISKCQMIGYIEKNVQSPLIFQALGKNEKSQDFNIIIFIITEEKSIYCITQGKQAFRVIDRILDSTFTQRVMKLTSTEEVSRYTTREFHGMYFSRQSYFRNPQTPSKSQTDGLVTSVHTRVRESPFLEQNSYLQLGVGHSVNRGARLKFTRAAVSICLSLTLREIIRVIEYFDCNLDKGGIGCDMFDDVNEVEDTDTKVCLEDLLIKQIERDLEKTEREVDEPFDFVYKDKLNTDCTSFILGRKTRIWDELSSYKDAILLLKEYREKESEKAEDLKNLKLSFKLKNKDHEDLFLSFFQGEREHEGKIYCKFNGQWLRIERNYRKQIRDDFTALIRNKFCGEDDRTIHLNEKWGSEAECDYILKYNKEYREKTLPMMIVGDGIAVQEHVELFDILKITRNVLYLYHVKEGFSKKIRDVCSQLRISAELVRAARYSDSEDDNCLREFHNRVANTNGEKNGRMIKRDAMRLFTEDEFRSMFRQKKVVYVLAFKDKKKTERLLRDYLENLDEFDNSVIARHELLFTNMYLEQFGFEFRICQIHSEPMVQGRVNIDAGSRKKKTSKFYLKYVN